MSEGKIGDEFVGLKSKMYSIKNIDGKESNTAKGVNIATATFTPLEVYARKKIVSFVVFLFDYFVLLVVFLFVSVFYA